MKKVRFWLWQQSALYTSNFLYRGSLALALIFYSQTSLGETSSISPSSEPTSTPSATFNPGFQSESELGLVITTGNSQANTLNLKQSGSYVWGEKDGNQQTLKLDGRYLSTVTSRATSALSWTLAIRYENQFTVNYGLYLGQNLESDIFAGYTQRYNSDLGQKHYLIKQDDFYWFAEEGYRYTLENERVGIQKEIHSIRVFLEAKKDLSKTTFVKLWIESLPEIGKPYQYRLNSELSVTALINTIFSIKTGYLVKYVKIPLPGTLYNTDTVLTTALVGKF